MEHGVTTIYREAPVNEGPPSSVFDLAISTYAIVVLIGGIVICLIRGHYQERARIKKQEAERRMGDGW